MTFSWWTKNVKHCRGAQTTLKSMLANGQSDAIVAELLRGNRNGKFAKCGFVPVAEIPGFYSEMLDPFETGAAAWFAGFD